MNFWSEIVDEKMGAGSVAPAPIKRESEEQDVAPIDEECGAIVDELGEQRCRKWRETDGAEEADVDPGEIAVGAREVVELGLLADPEDAIGHDAHEEYEQARRERDQQAAKVVFRVNSFGGGDAEVEDQERHSDGEDAVAEGGDALHTLTCNAVVQGVHPREFSIGIGVWREVRWLALQDIGVHSGKAARFAESTLAGCEITLLAGGSGWFAVPF